MQLAAAIQFDVPKDVLHPNRFALPFGAHDNRGQYEPFGRTLRVARAHCGNAIVARLVDICYVSYLRHGIWELPDRSASLPSGYF